MKYSKIIFSFLLCNNIICMQSSKLLPWNIVVYMEATGGKLYQAAFKNLNEMARNTPESAHIFAFLHTQGENGWLYHITKNNFHTIAEVPCTISVAQTLIDVMTIAVKEGPAHRFGLVFWNHGYGVLSPVYDEQQKEFIIPYDGPYNVIKRSKNQRIDHRGICVKQDHTFLSNEDMVYACDIICNRLLNGKKLAFCGMDICNGAMFEHAYQLYRYTDYLIASQEIEMLDGWPYDTVLQIVNDIPETSTSNIAIHIVNAFREYYEKGTQQSIYTLSALDLSYIEQLKHNIDGISKMLISMLLDNDDMKELLKQLRIQCKPFYDAPMYCDLYEWCSMLLNAFDMCNAINKNADENILFRQLLIDSLNLISTMTIACCSDPASAHAHACSIYFPQFAIDASYMTSSFAKDSCWISFLQQLL